MRNSEDFGLKIMKKILPLTLAVIMIFAPNLKVSAEDDFDVEMTEEEKQQMIDEIYEDINADSSYDINDEDRLTVEDIENGIKEEADHLSAEEVEEMLQKSLPSESEVNDMADSLGEHVLNLAKFHSGYDRAEKMYRYYYSSGKGISMSVPLGGWTNYAVAIKPDENIQLLNILRDGEVLPDSPGEDGAYFFREYGNYEFQIGTVEKGQSAVIPGTFKIVAPTEKRKDSFIWTPEGYSLDSVICNGRNMSFPDTRYTPLYEDGVYEINYKPVANLKDSLPDYSIYFVRDTTPPIIYFDGELEKGSFAGNVAYEVDDPDTEVKIWYNGQPAVSDSHILAAAGNYYITATDSTGNVREYNFIILRKGQIPWPLVIIFLSAFILMSMFVILTSKHYMRIK